MGTNNHLFFLCAKEHSARNLLLLLNTNRIVSDTYLTSSRSREPGFHPGSRLGSNHYWWPDPIPTKGTGTWIKTHLFSTYNRLSATRGSERSYAYGYSTVNHNKIHSISPLFISGFSDAEGCFNVGLQKNPNGKFYVRPLFQIKVHSKDNLLLMRIKDYFGGIGNIYISSKDSKFMVRSLDEVLKIISHFDNYPLITKKKSDFILFKQIIHKMVEGEHFSAKGLQEIVNIRASINLGLSDSLKAIFPNTVPVTRPRIENITIPRGVAPHPATNGGGRIHPE